MGFTAPASTIVNVSAAPATVNVTTASNMTTQNLYGAVVYGNGYDGAATIAGTVTLTRDMQYTTLTVNAGAILITAGFRVCCSVSLTNNGTIHNDGANGSGSIGGAGGIGGSLGAGGRGGNTPTYSGLAPPTADLYGGNGGGGGIYYGGFGAAGAANALTPLDTNGLSTRRVAGGAGGMGTGAGGGGGGVVALLAPTLVNNSVIRSKGGNGSATDAGGGGGGLVLLVYTNRVGVAPTTTGGTGIGAGLAGTSGTVGEVII